MEENFGHFWQDFTLQMRKFLVFLVEENPGIAYIEFCTHQLVEDLAKSCNPFLIFLSPPKNISAVFFFTYIELFLSFPTHSQAGIHTRTHTHTPTELSCKESCKDFTIEHQSISTGKFCEIQGFHLIFWDLLFRK